MAYKLLLGFTVLCSLGAVATMLPIPVAPWPNLLGFKSLCSFAPASTAACALLAAISCLVRSRLVSNQRARNRYRPLFVPLAVIVVLLAIAIPFAVRWTAYLQPDATAAASVEGQ